MEKQIPKLQTRATMINDKVRMYLLPPLFNAAVRAGAAIMGVYKNRDDYDISLKTDHTPITIADRLAHKTIREYLVRRAFRSFRRRGVRCATTNAATGSSTGS